MALAGELERPGDRLAVDQGASGRPGRPILRRRIELLDDGEEVAEQLVPS